MRAGGPGVKGHALVALVAWSMGGLGVKRHALVALGGVALGCSYSAYTVWP
jgi:hypothetical protein